MGSLADHAYVIADAEIECLVFDAEHFSDAGPELASEYPGLVLLGFGPNDVGEDYLALADQFEPAPRSARRQDRRPVHRRLHRRHDRASEGRADDPPGLAGDDLDPDGRVGVSRRPATAIATPLSHAAMSLLAPVLLSGGAFYVMEASIPMASSTSSRSIASPPPFSSR